MCAIASYRVLPAVSSGGGEFGEAIGSGISSYVDASLKRKKKEKAEEKKSAYHKAALESGMELSGLSYDEAGKGKYSYKKKKDPGEAILKDPGKTIKRAMLGLGDPETIGPAFDIARPEPVETLHGPIIGAADQDYGQVVQRALKERFAPNVEQSVISRDFLGLPQEKAPKSPTKEIPPEFTSDVQQLKQIAQSDPENSEDIFATGIQKLGMKYVDNPEVINRIKLILQMLNQ